MHVFKVCIRSIFNVCVYLRLRTTYIHVNLFQDAHVHVSVFKVYIHI